MKYSCIRCGQQFEAKHKTAVCEKCHTAVCVVCGKEFELQTPWTQVTCSAKCRGIYRRQSGIAKKAAEKSKNTFMENKYADSEETKTYADAFLDAGIKYSISPYIMGLILGDGSFRYYKANKSFMFSSENSILPNIIANELNLKVKRHKSNKYCWYFEHTNQDNKHKNLWVEELLKDYPELWNTNSHTKFIPEDYLFGSIEQRKELLRGLLDTDGSIRGRTA